MNPIEIKNLGASIGRTTLDDSLIQELLQHSENLYKRANKALAGKIEDEKFYEEESKAYFEKKLLPYAISFYDECEKDKGIAVDIEYKKMARWKLDALWVNRQEPGEYNPPHEHSGNISFVIYLQMPYGMYEEVNPTNGSPPGYISFRYGSDNRMFPSGMDGQLSERYVISELEAPLRPLTNLESRPVVGEMFIFPSFLTHNVEAFNSPGTRISVSGNFSLEFINE